MRRAQVGVRCAASGIAASVFVHGAVAMAMAPPSASPARSNEPGDPVFVARALALYGFRHYQYSGTLDEYDRTMPRLQSYDLDRGAGAGLDLGLYPFASGARRSVELGIVGSFRKEALLADSRVATVPIDASSSEWLAALRLQIPTGPHDLGVSVGAGSHSFSLTDASRNPQPVPVPDVAWMFVRAAVDVRLNVHPLFLGFAFGYRAPFAAGEIGSYDWFPRLTVSGIDGSIFWGASLSDNVEISVGYELRRYAFAAHSKGGDTAVAGGAVDLYGSGWLALGLRL